MMNLICPECGEENDLESVQCQGCGANLEDVTISNDDGSQSSNQDERNSLPQADHDLPGLLHALKKGNEIDPDEEDQKGSMLPDPSSPREGLMDESAMDDEKVPEWLNRIRQRAKEEADSIGEITQKISAARESMAEEKISSQHDAFESLIDNIRAQPQDDQPEEEDRQTADPQDESLAGEKDWLARIRMAQGLNPEGSQAGTTGESHRAGDSLLQWLVALEDNQSGQALEREADPVDQGSKVKEDNQETALDQIAVGDTTQQVTAVREVEPGIEKPTLAVSREERRQADQLSAMVMDERIPRSVREPVQQASIWILRMVVSLILIAILGLALFTSSNNRFSQWLLRPSTDALLGWVEALPEDTSLLLVFDYQAGFSSELSIIASPVLKSIDQSNVQISVLSTSAAGPLLSRQLFNEIIDLDVGDWIDLGYIPVTAFGAYGLANPARTHGGFIDQPKTGISVPVEKFDGILILSDSYEGASIWIEQVSTLAPEIPINLLVTAQAGPMLLPYYESGQVIGMISGIADAAAHETLHKDGSSVAYRWRAYQAGVIMLIVLMVAGAVFAGPGPMEDEGSGWYDPE